MEPENASAVPDAFPGPGQPIPLARDYFVQVTFRSPPARSAGRVKMILWAETVPLIWSRSDAEVCRNGAKVTSNDLQRTVQRVRALLER